MANAKREKHKCPRLPAGDPKITPAGWNGESAEQAQRMWFAWLRIVSAQHPRPRNTTGER